MSVMCCIHRCLGRKGGPQQRNDRHDDSQQGRRCGDGGEAAEAETPCLRGTKPKGVVSELSAVVSDPTHATCLRARETLWSLAFKFRDCTMCTIRSAASSIATLESLLKKDNSMA